MTLKRLISIICLITILIDIQPVGASENYNKINNSIEQEELDSQDDNESEESLQDDNENAESLQSGELVTNESQNNSLQEDNENEESLQSDEFETNESQNNPLQDVIFKFSIEKISNPYLQIGFDNLSLTYTSKIDKEILNSIKDYTIISDMNKEIINLVIWDVVGNEKLNLMISMDYLLNNDSLSELESIEYKNGDKIFIKVLQEEICSVSIDGILQQQITLEQENYSDGIDNLDYLNNVYFAVESTGVTAIYNEAPIIEGIIDSEVSNFSDFDPLEGVTVLDDHDENLIESLKVESKDLSENQKEFTYSVADKFGRATEANNNLKRNK